MNQTLAEKLKANLAKLNKQFGESHFWKPKAGDNVIRILPNFSLSSDPNAEPFLLLRFYYEFGKKFLAPHQFDMPDFAFKMYLEMIKDSDEDVKRAAKKLRSAQRIYVPVLVRGHESDGPKFWEFGLKVYEMLKGLYDNPEWGNISDLENGVDITVTFVPSPDSNDPKLSKTSVTPARRSTPATTDPVILEKIKNLPDLVSLFTLPSESELEAAVKSYLSLTDDSGSADDFDVKKLDGHLPPKPISPDVDDVEKKFEEIMNRSAK